MLHFITDFYLCFLLTAVLVVFHLENKKKLDALETKISTLDKACAAHEAYAYKVCKKLEALKVKMSAGQSKVKVLWRWVQDLEDDLEEKLGKLAAPIDETKSIVCDPPASAEPGFAHNEHSGMMGHEDSVHN